MTLALLVALAGCTKNAAVGNGTGGVFSEQVIRPTRPIHPLVEVKPVEDQVDDLVHVAKETARHSTEGKPGTQKGRFGKTSRTRMGGRR